MSTTMPCESRSSARNATRTTKVAPCTFCAGPNSSPRNEWAIMIWSETSTAYTEDRRIADQWTHPFGLATQNRRQLRRQIVEGYAGTQQDIQHRLLEKRKRRHEAPAARPPRAVRWRDASDLAGYEPQAPTVERLAEGRRDVAGSIPAQLDDARLLARKA